MDSKPPEAPNGTIRNNPNASPKARFVASPKLVSQHRDMVDSGAFSLGCDIALLQYQVLQSERINDGNTAMAAGFKMQGASELVAILKTISESSSPVPRKDRNNLDHNQ